MSIGVPTFDLFPEGARYNFWLVPFTINKWLMQTLAIKTKPKEVHNKKKHFWTPKQITGENLPMLFSRRSPLRFM